MADTKTETPADELSVAAHAAWDQAVVDGLDITDALAAVLVALKPYLRPTGPTGPIAWTVTVTRRDGTREYLPGTGIYPTQEQAERGRARLQKIADDGRVLVRYWVTAVVIIEKETARA